MVTMSHPDAQGQYELTGPPSPGHIHKRSRQSSEDFSFTPDKREQARERQRRKRERDRALSVTAIYPEGISDANLHLEEQHMGGMGSSTIRRRGGGKRISLEDLPPEEAQKKQRIREAARERQRKHRAGVKAKRMAELGMAIVNEGGGIEQTAIGYTINENGQYEAVLADPSDPNLQHAQVGPFHTANAHATPGQMFASTLLLGLSCTPHLKQQLLRTLRSTNEDLTAFEPFIAAAFDHWEHGRSLHYAAQGHNASPLHHLPQAAPYAHPYPSFNERFQRSLVAAFPASPQHDRDQSPSPSEESHRDSEAQIEPESSAHPHQESLNPNRDPEHVNEERIGIVTVRHIPSED
ncbi:hypothetical protein K439DRAFT_1622234 [Ramaria rubella]|nr:hypothetical protein K439DRAFT_1622234 [Ramaria rubella]